MKNKCIDAFKISKLYPGSFCEKSSIKFTLKKILSLLWPFISIYDKKNEPFAALENISFQLQYGETLGIIGLNGSGKSTLLQIIAGTIKPSSGKMLINGKVAALLELGSGFNPDFTGKENIFLNASIYGLSEDDVKMKLPQIEAFAELGSFINQPVKTYSSGMSLRLAFAVIANIDPDILIIDEALSVGDAIFTQKCLRFLRSYQKKHSLIFVSHDLSAIKSLCDKCLWLQNGRVKAFGSAKKVSEMYLSYTLANEVKENSLAKQIKFHKSSTNPHYTNNISSSNDFGTKESEITNVSLKNCETKNDVAYYDREQEVTLTINARCYEEIANPMVGFFVRDRLGQDLFGENSYGKTNTTSCVVPRNSALRCSFRFKLPCLPIGQYSVSVAIAKGDMTKHTILHWKHDALIIESGSTDVKGLVGIKMDDIDIKSQKIITE